VRSCLIDGEAVACDDNGVAVFARLRCKPSGRHVFLFAFDLLEVNGIDLRREPLEVRKNALVRLLDRALPGLQLNGPLPILAMLYSATPANLVTRASSRNAWARVTSPVGRRIGSSSRTRKCRL
jgi:ATP-dependent DNA ligase